MPSSSSASAGTCSASQTPPPGPAERSGRRRGAPIGHGRSPPGSPSYRCSPRSRRSGGQHQLHVFPRRVRSPSAFSARDPARRLAGLDAVHDALDDHAASRVDDAAHDGPPVVADRRLDAVACLGSAPTGCPRSARRRRPSLVACALRLVSSCLRSPSIVARSRSSRPLRTVQSSTCRRFIAKYTSPQVAGGSRRVARASRDSIGVLRDEDARTDRVGLPLSICEPLRPLEIGSAVAAVRGERLDGRSPTTVQPSRAAVRNLRRDRAVPVFGRLRGVDDAGRWRSIGRVLR